MELFSALVVPEANAPRSYLKYRLPARTTPLENPVALRAPDLKINLF